MSFQESALIPDPSLRVQSRVSALLLDHWTVECVKSHLMFRTDAIARVARRGGLNTEEVRAVLQGGAAARCVWGGYWTHAHQVHYSTWIACYAL